jgi:heptosyltransferase-2
MGFGNMVLLLPTLEALRSSIPNARLLLVADRRTDAWQALDYQTPWVDVEWTDTRALGVAGFVDLVRRVRRHRPEVALLNANTSAEPVWAALARWSGARWRVGHTNGGDFLNPYGSVYNVPVPPVAGGDEIAHNLALVDALMGTGTPASGRPAPFVGPDDDASARAALAAARTSGRVVVGLHVTSSPTQPWKRWPPRYFAELSGALLVRGDIWLVLLGAPEDREAIDSFEIYGSATVTDLVGRTGSMREAAAVVSRLDLLVCGDTGLMQTAGAVGTPAVAIYGPTDWTRTLPRSSGVRMVTRGEPCSPCFFRTTQENPSTCPHHRCLEELTAASVLESVISSIGMARERR